MFHRQRHSRTTYTFFARGSARREGAQLALYDITHCSSVLCPFMIFQNGLPKGTPFASMWPIYPGPAGHNFPNRLNRPTAGGTYLFPTQSFDTIPSNIRPNSPGATTAVSSNNPNLAPQSHTGKQIKVHIAVLPETAMHRCGQLLFKQSPAQCKRFF